MTSEIENAFFADADKPDTCESAGEPLTAKLPAWAKAAAATDSHLAAVLTAWATLPEIVEVDGGHDFG